MASFFDVKRFLGSLLKCETEIDEECDLVFRRIQGPSESGVQCFIPNEALKRAFDEYQAYSEEFDASELSLVGPKYREVALTIDLGQEIFEKLEDSTNGYIYMVGPASSEFCMFLLASAFDYCSEHEEYPEIQEKVLHWFHSRIPRERDSGVSWDSPMTLSECVQIYTLRIYTNKKLPSSQLRELAASYEFSYMYKRGTPLREYSSLEDIFLIGTRSRYHANEEVDLPPLRKYNADVLDFYAMALESTDPFTTYISFYHIIEYYFDTVFRKKLVEDIRALITHPDFSYKKDKQLYDLAQRIRKHMSIDDDFGRGNEFDSLIYVLREYVPIDELKKRLSGFDSEAIDYYCQNPVPFASSTKQRISWTDENGVYTTLANRIYQTRNALVHSKSEKENKQYRPYKHKKELLREIPLIRSVAELVLINSSEIL